MVNDVEKYQDAILALESQREVLGDAVVDVTTATLREFLDRLDEGQIEETGRLTAQRKQVTILFANVTGFSGFAETISDTSMLDVMNVLWHRLDSAITNHGGLIDKHTGDGVMGVFGVPTARENDPERAIRAALSMRAALSDFLSDLDAMQRAGHFPQLGDKESNNAFRNLRLNIGINTGQAMLGDVGNSRDEYTVIGDTVNVASRLERAASSGGILISHDTYMLVRGLFNVEPLGPVPLKGRSEPIPVYMVLGVRPRLFYASGRGVEGIETRMVGRDRELGQLQEIVKTAVQQKRGRVITVVGDAGVGKSRLLHEFNNWIRSLSREFPSLKGRTYERTQETPYSLFRDMFATKFNIQENDPATSVEDKLVQGLQRYIDGDEEEVQNRVRHIAQLLGLEITSDIAAIGSGLEAHQVRERAYAHISEFFERLSADYPATLLFLEDIHWADDGSLELVEHLSEICDRRPFIIISLARPSLFSRKTTSILTAVNGNRPQSKQLPLRIELAALSEQDSAKLVKNILHKIENIPQDLTQLIVERSEGNPFYLEELIKVLIEDGIIITGQEKWRVHANQLKEVRIPPNITGVLQARLDRLSGLERTTLQRAAVIGRLFWDTAVIHMNDLADDPISPADTMAALNALEKREMIFPRQSSLIVGAQTYIFKHALLQQVTYESVLLRIRPEYHRQVADWLVELSAERLPEYASQVARHYELAGDRQPAADLYEIAANRARETYKPQIASDYYRRALSLLSEQTLFSAAQLRLQEQMGRLLHAQARFVEASQTYMTMRFTAMEDGDLVAQAEAWLGLANVQSQQAKFQDVLESATQAEQVAWLVNAETSLAHALMLKAEAYQRLGDYEHAINTANRLLDLTNRLAIPEEHLRSLGLLTDIYAELGEAEQVMSYIKRAKDQVSRLKLAFQSNPTRDLKQAVAFGQAALGMLYNRINKHEQAAYQLLNALRLYRENESLHMVGHTLNQLGETVRLRGSVERAVSLYREALQISRVIGDVYAGMTYRTNLGVTLVELGEYKSAHKELSRAVRLAEDVSKIVSWHDSVKLYSAFALAKVGIGEVNEAVTPALFALQQAYAQKRPLKQARAWRTMGQILSEAIQETVDFEETTYYANDCFGQSLQVLKSTDDVASFREQVFTLWAWSQHEARLGNVDGSQKFANEAVELAERLKISLPYSAQSTR